MKNWTIGRRLAVGFALLLIINAIAAVVTVTTLRHVRTDIGDISRDVLPTLKIVNHLQRDVLSYRILVNRHILSDSDEEMQQLDARCDEIAQSVLKQIQQYGDYVSGAEERALFNRIEPTLNSYRESAKQIRALSRARQDAEAIALLKGEGARRYDAFEESVTWDPLESTCRHASLSIL